jgi:transposase-like protein
MCTSGSARPPTMRRSASATTRVVTTDRAAAYLRALAKLLPGTTYVKGKMVQQRLERDHEHLEERLRPTCGFRTLADGRVLCSGQALIPNVVGRFNQLEVAVANAVTLPPLVPAWATLRAVLLAR